MKENNDNPFIITGRIPVKYFCDRKKDTKLLIDYILNKNNVLLLADRRLGKSELIHHCFEQAELDDYVAIYVDILPTSSLSEFVFALGKAVHRQLVRKDQKLVMSFLRALKSIKGTFGLDLTTGLPTLDIALGDIVEPEYTLGEIFGFIESEGIKCIIAIDEFQQICKYPEKNVEALLRSHIQQIGDCRFVFAGSEKSILSQMFLSSARPFYNSVTIQELTEIPAGKYTEFVVSNFQSKNRGISPETVEKVYDYFKGNTYYMQKTFNKSFMMTPEEGECSTETVNAAIASNVMENDRPYRELFSMMSARQKQLLIAIAEEGEAEKITSGQFLVRHSFISTSMVQSATRQLLERNLIQKKDDKYRLSDAHLRIWLMDKYSTGDLDRTVF